MQKEDQTFSAELYATKNGSLFLAGRVLGGDLQLGDVLVAEYNGMKFEIEEIESYQKNLLTLNKGMTGGLKLRGLSEGDLELPCLLRGRHIQTELSTPLRAPRSTSR